MIRNWIDLLRVVDYYRIAERIGRGITWDKRLDGTDLITELGSDLRISLLKPLVVNTFGNLSKYAFLLDMRSWYKLRDLSTYSMESTLEFMPSFMAARGIQHKTNMVCGDYDGQSDRFAEQFKFGSLLFVWGQVEQSPTGNILKHDFPSKDAGFPTVVEMKNARLTLVNGVLSASSKSDISAGRAALRTGTLSVAWGDMNMNDETGFGARRAGAPVQTWIRGYKEFWLDGTMHGSRWDDMYHKWTSPIPGANTHHIPSFLKDRCIGATDPFSNRFFTNDTDEFNFMSEFQLPG